MLVTSNTHKTLSTALPNVDFMMQNKILQDNQIIVVCDVDFPISTLAVSPVETKACYLFLIIEVNHEFFGCMEFDMGGFSSLRTKNLRRQHIWTLLLSIMLGDSISTCAQ
jgi:hypothetical protein